MEDSIVKSVIESFKQRSELGILKYGKTLDRNDLTFLQWIQHAQEELMDAILYLEKLKNISRPTESNLNEVKVSSSMQDRPSQT
jgi:hypothetical protein